MMMRPVDNLDLADLSRWYEARGQGRVRRDMLPHHGVMVPGVAAGFLYRTDSGICILDGYVTNPEAPVTKRAEALREITDFLLESARFGGASYCMALCKTRGVEKLARRNGFERVGVYALTGKEL